MGLLDIMRAVICVLLCAVLGCLCFKPFIFKDPQDFRMVETPRIFIECKVCNTTNPFILTRYSAIEEEAVRRCKYLYNGVKECPPNTSVYYNSVCDREECYLRRGEECEEKRNFSFRGIECAPGVACDQHSDGKHRCGPELFRNDKIRRTDDTLKSLRLPLAFRLPRLYEELASRYGTNDRQPC